MTNSNQARSRKTQSAIHAANPSRTRQASSKQKSTPAAAIFLILLHAILGFGALGGGAMLIFDPTGEAMGMPVSMLERTFFPSFLIPGILLLVVFGLFPLLVAYAIWRRPDWKAAQALNPYRNDLHPAWALSLYVGFGQIIWITVQTYMMNAVHIVHLGYTALGLIILIVTLLPSVRTYLLKNE
ncbi:hypothetical protein [Saccharibacillus endophyticus]|uniref:Uncharacterized protein n=1 Tax=Saccharibacillus endophyticus TaxID=2060666 RepID=A0ABQ1ZUB1_9BACL|nr:hypothetical protein [Saccharibacillus endophyticus]GGH76129.1 hypothetical protein GCM10007362_17910 [Saccharibacillus endophyticus]